MLRAAVSGAMRVVFLEVNTEWVSECDEECWVF
jgi:hypothetical protein